jgi:integrase
MSTCARRGRRRTPSRWHPKTAKHYAGLYDLHIAPHLGGCKLGELSAEMISRWQAERIAAGAGREAVLQALMLPGSILQRAVEGEWIACNPARIVRKVKRAPRREVRPLAPVTVETLRGASRERDAVLVSVLAYAGLRPQEALALCWGHVRDRTILVERAVSLGELKDTKTRAHRTVRLLAPLQDDLRAWWQSSGVPSRRDAGVPASARSAVDEDRLGQLAPAGVRRGVRGGLAVRRQAV